MYDHHLTTPRVQSTERWRRCGRRSAPNNQATIPDFFSSAISFMSARQSFRNDPDFYLSRLLHNQPLRVPKTCTKVSWREVAQTPLPVRYTASLPLSFQKNLFLLDIPHHHLPPLTPSPPIPHTITSQHSPSPPITHTFTSHPSHHHLTTQHTSDSLLSGPKPSSAVTSSSSCPCPPSAAPCSESHVF